VSESKLENINLQTDFSLKTGVKDTEFWNLMSSAQCTILKEVPLKWMLVSVLLKQMRGFVAVHFRGRSIFFV
jgi:hypothetical protein